VLELISAGLISGPKQDSPLTFFGILANFLARPLFCHLFRLLCELFAFGWQKMATKRENGDKTKLENNNKNTSTGCRESKAIRLAGGRFGGQFSGHKQQRQTRATGWQEEGATGGE